MRVFLTILAAAILLTACTKRPEVEPPARINSQTPILQVGLVLDAPATDTIQMAFPQNERGGRNTNGVLTVRMITGLDETNLEKEQRVWQRGDAVAAEIRFKGKARQQLADFTRTNVGKDVALIIDEKVFWTMEIGGEVSDGWFLVRGKWTLKEAQAFCKRLDKAASSRKEPEGRP
jgi:preprotein translocase subunit SecD